MKGLSVIIPTYNESESIVSSLNECLNIFRSFGMPFELIVVDDGSVDSTAKLVRKFSRSNPVKIVSYRRNKGKGHALKHAFNEVSMDLVTFLDADLELHPNQLKNFIKIMKETNADVVIGSKRHPKSKLFYPWQRKFLLLY